MTDTESLMRAWLATGTDAQKIHARARVAVGFGPPAPAVEAPPASFEPFTPAWIDRINTCLYRECRTGCLRSLCHAGRGDSWGQTTLENCRSCLRGDRP